MPSTPTDAALRAALGVLVEQWREHAGNMWLHSDTAAGVRACADALDAALRARETEPPAPTPPSSHAATLREIAAVIKGGGTPRLERVDQLRAAADALERLEQERDNTAIYVGQRLRQLTEAESKIATLTVTVARLENEMRHILADTDACRAGDHCAYYSERLRDVLAEIAPAPETAR